MGKMANCDGPEAFSKKIVKIQAPKRGSQLKERKLFIFLPFVN